MSIVQEFQKPDLFITFTTNPNWKEIQENLFENQTAYFVIFFFEIHC